MYICICRQVTDQDIHEAVAEGACRMRDLRERLGVARNAASAPNVRIPF